MHTLVDRFGEAPNFLVTEFWRWTPTTFDAHMGLLVYLEDLLGRRVDVVTAKGLKPRMRPLIDRDLVRVA